MRALGSYTVLHWWVYCYAQEISLYIFYVMLVFWFLWLDAGIIYLSIPLASCTGISATVFGINH